jgi:plasmid maintenance system killer protein
MQIQFKSAKLEKQCNNRREAVKACGERRANLVAARLAVLRAAVTLEDVRQAPGDCHEYRHKKEPELTLDLDGRWRLCFRPMHDPLPLLADEKSLAWTKVTCVEITDVRDHH